MKKKVVLSILLVILVLVGCSNPKKTEDKTADEISQKELINNEMNSDDNSEVQYMYGFEIKNNNKKLEYSGKPIDLQYSVDNEGSAMDTGMLIFVNGILQPYHVDDENDESIMHIFHTEKKEGKNYDFSFIPILGEEGDKLNVRFVSMLNPATFPDKEKFSYENNTKILSIFPKKIYIDSPVKGADNKEKEYIAPSKMTDDEVKKYQYTDSHGNYRDKLKAVYFEVLDENGEDDGYLASKDDILEFTLKGLGGDDDEYVIYTFINNVPLDEEKLTVFQINNGKYYTQKNIKIDLSKLDKKYKLGEFNSFYVIACPVSDIETNDVFKTTSAILERK